ncbi:hypothetical protein OSTOST_12539 [Ostertagia ostertagi]
MVATAEFDVLRDEGIQYVRKLREENVPCEWKHYKRAYHGVCNFPGSSVGNEVIADFCRFLKKYI